MEVFNSFPSFDVIPIIPELIVICVALLLLLLDLIMRRKEVIAFVAITGVIAAVYSTFKLYTLSGYQSAFAAMFILDGYSNFFKLIFYLNVILTICISLRYVKIERVSFGEYYALILFATSGMMIMASAADLIVLYLGLELMALSTYVLVGIVRHNIKANEAAIKYFLLGGFSSALLLYGTAMIYGLTGTTEIKAVAEYVIDYGLVDNKVLLLSVILFVVAFGFKIAVVPFHMWAPDAYEGALTSITAFMSVGPKAAGFAALGRVFMISFASVKVQWQLMLIPLAILSMCVGNVLAIAQTNIKRMLAYSSIAHAGYALLGVIAGTPEGLSSMMSYMFIYAFMNIGAFAVVIMLRRKGFRGEDLSDYEGLAKKYPLASALMLVFMFSLTGIPPTAGFIGKFYVFMEAIKAGYTYLAIIAVIFSVISAFFYLRLVMFIYMKEPREEVVLTTSPSMSFALAFTTMMIIILGVFPSLLLNFARFSILG